MAGCSSGAFSIRDYVLKMREVDAEKSWPFPGDEVKDAKRWPLPPMERSKPAVWWAHELERAMRSEAGETAALPKLCPVCSTFTTTTITAVNAHIDACLAGTKEAPPTHRRRRRRTAKKRSIAELIAASPPVGPAGDKHHISQEAPPPERDLTVITYKKRRCAYVKEMMKKTKGPVIEPIKVQHSNKLGVLSGYLSGILRSAYLRRKQKYKFLATMILHKRRRARPRLLRMRKLLRAHRTRLLAKLLKIKPLVSRKLIPPSILKPSDDSFPEKSQEKEENRRVTISDKIEILGQTKPAASSSELPQTQPTDEAATTMDSNVGSKPPLEGTMDLNQVILNANDGKMESKSPQEASHVQTFSNPEEGSAPIPPPSCIVQPMEVSSTKKCSRPSSTVYRPQPRRFQAGGVDLAPHFFQSGQSSNLPAYNHSCSSTNLQPSTVYGRRQVNEGCIGLPLNSQGEVIYSFHPGGMAGLNHLHGKQYEAGHVDDCSIYRSFVAAHSNRMEHLNLIDKNIHGSQSYGGQTVGLINPEKTGNSHQELNSSTYAYHGRHAAHSRLPARDGEMQYVTKGNYQQTVRLMGKNLTVVNGNEGNLSRGGRTATENYFPQGNYFDNSMSRHSLQEGSNRLQWPSVQSLGAGFASSSGARPFGLRPDYVAKGNYNSEKQGFGHQLEINHSQGYAFQAIPARLIDPQRIPPLRSQCSQWQVVGKQLDHTQFTSENLPKWLVDASRQKEGLNIARPPLPPPPPRAPIIRQSPCPTPSSPLVQSPHWSAFGLRSDANVWSRVKSNIARNSRSVSYKDVGSLKPPGKRPADRPDGLACPSKKSNVTGPKNSASGIDLNVDPKISNAEVSRDELDVLSSSRFLDKGESSRNVSDFDPIPDNIARSEPLKLTPGAKHILRPSPNVYQNNPRPMHSTMPINEIVNCGKVSEFHIRSSRVFTLK